MKFVLYKDRRGEWRWRLVGRGGRILADSGEGYVKRAAMLRSLNNIVFRLSERAYEVVTKGK